MRHAHVLNYYIYGGFRQIVYNSQNFFVPYISFPISLIFNAGIDVRFFINNIL